MHYNLQDVQAQLFSNVFHFFQHPVGEVMACLKPEDGQFNPRAGTMAKKNPQKTAECMWKSQNTQ